MDGAIPAAAVRFHPASYVDEAGRLFLWEGGCYRGIADARAAHVRRVLAHPSVAGLTRDGILIPSHVSTRTLDGFAFLLEHPVIPTVSYAVEWTPEMLRDAALATLTVAETIGDAGWVLQDAHPWNVLFDGSRPVFVDFGSIVPARDDILWAPYEQFCRFFLAPLELAAAGQWDVARRFLADERSGIDDALLARLLPVGRTLRHPMRSMGRAANRWATAMLTASGAADRVAAALRHAHRARDARTARRLLLAGLRRAVERIPLSPLRSPWSRYYGCDMTERGSELAAKERVIRDLLTTLHPARVVDVGANAGHFALLAASLGADVVALERDPACAAACYRGARAAHARVLSLTMDILNPTPASGWRGEQFPAATSRIRGDVVLALALLHHLAITERQGFARALAAIESFSDRHVIVEFVGPRDPMAAQLLARRSDPCPWYTWEEFLRVVQARSSDVRIMEPHASDRRMVLYGVEHR